MPAVGRQDWFALFVAKLANLALAARMTGALGFVDHVSTEPDKYHAYPQ
jgi:hypothetical protein